MRTIETWVLRVGSYFTGTNVFATSAFRIAVLRMVQNTELRVRSKVVFGDGHEPFWAGPKIIFPDFKRCYLPFSLPTAPMHISWASPKNISEFSKNVEKNPIEVQVSEHSRGTPKTVKRDADVKTNKKKLNPGDLNNVYFRNFTRLGETLSVIRRTSRTHCTLLGSAVTF
ncbi:hypothetical protein FB451DRAFT_1229185 [Mycena latifolia]|nr:hypothetical protein FB451DRAFT_1229185 [Mycena latifolia]